MGLCVWSKCKELTNFFYFFSLPFPSPSHLCSITHCIASPKVQHVDVPNSEGALRETAPKPLSPPSPPSPLPRVRVRCPRLRSALTFSPGTIGRPGRTFYGKRLAGKGSDGGIGAVGVVTAKLVSGNRHRAYSLNSSAFGIIVIPSLPEGGTLPYKSLHTSSDPACPPD